MLAQSDILTLSLFMYKSKSYVQIAKDNREQQRGGNAEGLCLASKQLHLLHVELLVQQYPGTVNIEYR